MICSIDRLAVIRIAEIMSEDIVTVRDTDTMFSAVETIRSNRVSGAPVVDQHDHCVGVLSLVDCVQVTPCGEARPNDIRSDLVLDHMVSPVISIDPTSSLIDSARLMCTKRVRRLPVLDEDGRLVGMVSARDIVAALVVAAG